ncbi:MAG: SCO family protein [Verrucomicrobia bacterium]|nr:SCO family protein [Kiritimatiellia bacterium]MCO6399866.1 SCO family protein [Verrucomicrobiota bacterium]
MTHWAVIALSAALLGVSPLSRASTRSMPMEGKVEPPPPELLKRAGFEQKLGAQLPMDALVRDEEGRTVPLGTFFNNGRPVVFLLVYYECPMLCNLILNGTVDVLKEIPFAPGKEYDVVTLSFNHRETHVLAARKKATYMKEFNREGAQENWHFLTADEPAIAQIAAAAGFEFAWDEKAQEYAHASGIMIASPEGKLSHYFYGVLYTPRDVRLALVEASAGKIGSPVDQLMLYCYHYNPTMGSYTAAVMNIVRAGCFATIAALGLFLTVSWRRERRAHTTAA